MGDCYLLVGKDQYYNNWVLREERDRVTVRLSYKPLQCPCCGKVDEEAALQLPFEDDVRIRSRSDFLRTNEGLLCLSDRAQTLLHDHQIHGLRFLPLPGGQGYSIAVPTVFVSVDMNLAGFQYDGEPCPVCRRYPEICVGPLRQSFTVPDDPLVIFAGDVYLENIVGRNTWVMVSDTVRKILRASRLTGVEFYTPL